MTIARDSGTLLTALALAALALAAPAGCARGGAPARDSSATREPAARGPEPARLPDSLTGYFRFNSGYEDRTRLVIRDSATWAAAWIALVGSQRPRPAAPPIDFGRQMVLLSAAGTRPSGGFSISIDEYDAGPPPAAIVTTTSPGSTCGVTAALTAPADVAIVPRTDAPLRWVDRAATRECE